jgi:hypothetical protein
MNSTRDIVFKRCGCTVVVTVEELRVLRALKSSPVD